MEMACKVPRLTTVLVDILTLSGLKLFMKNYLLLKLQHY